MYGDKTQAQVQSIIANPQPGGNPCTGDVLTKNIGYFTSTSVPSIVVGRGENTCTATGGMFLNYSTGNINGPWQQSTIESTGDHYERAVAFTNNNESYPGIVTSEGQADLTRYLFNPLNSGGNVLGPWSSTTIAQESCHDMHTADIDGDGKLDIVCSADPSNGEEGGYVAYQNSPTSWDEVPYTTPLTSDGIGIININGIWDIAVSNTGATYLYWNPLNNGQNPRTTTWQAYTIGTGAQGNSLEGGYLNGVPTIFECSNETGYAGNWPPGCVFFQPNGTNYTGTWNMTEIDNTYVDVHQIDAALYAQGAAAYNSSGIPNLPTYLNGIVVAEEEQASSVCNSDGLNDHPDVSGCRVTYFSYNGDGTFTPVSLSDLGSHNESVIGFNGELALGGANHDVYGAVDPALHIWLFSPSSVSPPPSQPTSAPTPAPPPSQPTPSPTPTAPAAPSGSFDALIGGGTLDSSYVIDAGFFTAAYGFPPAAETYLYYQTNPYQQFIFAPSGSNYTICNVESGACLTDGGNVVDIGQGTDTWAVNQSGAGWTLQDTRTGQYMGAIPLTSESNIPMSSTPVTVSLSIIQ